MIKICNIIYINILYLTVLKWSVIHGSAQAHAQEDVGHGLKYLVYIHIMHSIHTNYA